MLILKKVKEKNKKNRPQREFSKQIFYIVITLFIIVIFYSMALMWKTDAIDGLVYLITPVSGLAATTIGFYFWKAKMENMIKLSKKYNITIDEIKEIEENGGNTWDTQTAP